MVRFSALIVLILIFSANATAQVAVIAHKLVPADKVSSSELLDFYTGDIKAWKNDLPVVVTDLKPKSEVKEAFYDFLGKSTTRMKSIWMKKMLSGEGAPPDALATEKEIVERVASTPGAIGFVSVDLVTEKVKTLVLIEMK